MGKAPEKNCPKCKKTLHVRKRACPCGYEFPKAKKKRAAKPKTIEQEEVRTLFEGWKKVPPRSRKLTCGLCRRKMKGGMLGWHCSYNDGEKYWWCDRCIKEDEDYVSENAKVHKTD